MRYPPNKPVRVLSLGAGTQSSALALKYDECDGMCGL